MISGLELLDAADVDDNDWVSNGDDEFSGSSETNDGEGSPVTVAFRCYHSLPSAQLSDDVQVCCIPVCLCCYLTVRSGVCLLFCFCVTKITGKRWQLSS